jgi:hypothetical protein
MVESLRESPCQVSLSGPSRSGRPCSFIGSSAPRSLSAETPTRPLDLVPAVSDCAEEPTDDSCEQAHRVEVQRRRLSPEVLGQRASQGHGGRSPLRVSHTPDFRPRR